MKVIFVKDTDVGQKGEIGWIKKGYARNYFFPRKEAVPATQKNLDLYKELVEVSYSYYQEYYMNIYHPSTKIRL